MVWTCTGELETGELEKTTAFDNDGDHKALFDLIVVRLASDKGRSQVSPPFPFTACRVCQTDVVWLEYGHILTV